MKKKIFEIAAVAVILIVIVLMVKVVFAEPVDVYHSGWHLIRETASEDAASFADVYDLTGATASLSGNFDNKDSSSVANGGPFRILPKDAQNRFGMPISGWGKSVFVICGENFNNIDDTFSFDVVGWARGNGMAQVICTGDGVIGTQAVVVYPDGGDAMGALISETGVTYTTGTTTFTTTGNGFAGAVVGMLARVTGTNITNNEFVQVTTVTDDNTIICSGVTSTGSNTDSTVEINPAFWVDAINLDATTTWPKQQGDLAGVANYSAGANKVAMLVIELQGIEFVQFVLYDCDGATAEQAGNLTVYGRPY